MDARSHQVLIVDDNAQIGSGLVRLLTLLKFKAQSVTSADAALTCLSQSDIDIILIDIGMPGTDGYALAQILRTEMNLTTPLVALTGYSSPEDQEKVRLAGFDAHLTKPVGATELHEAIRRLLTA